ncbi:VOC family protein [Chitinophagaceae bacterium MMS25-I14]
MQQITTFLMFEDKKAEEAMNFYMSLFEDSSVISMHRYAAGEPGIEGTIKHAVFSLNGQQFMVMDSSVHHGFSFTPAMSLFIACQTEDELDRLFEELSRDGKILMPAAPYPFSKKYGWTNDRYGVSWQLTLI